MMNRTLRFTAAAIFVVLFAPRLPAAGEAMQEVEDVLDKGGVVLWIIVGLSVVGLALAMERLLATRWGRLQPARLRGLLESEDTELAGLESAVQEANAPLERMIRAGLERRRGGRAAMERAIEIRGELELARLARPIRPLGVLAQVEPLLGLLGTVFGMIGTFAALQDTSAAERVARLAPGIGQALYTTAAGLTAAVPFVLLHHHLGARVQRAAEEWSLLGARAVDLAFPEAETEDAA